MNDIKGYRRIAVGEVSSFHHYALLLTHSASEGCDIQISKKDNVETFRVKGRQQGMMAFAPSTITIERGELYFILLDFTQLAKLQVFIDKPQNRECDYKTRALFGYMPTTFESNPTLRDIEYWLLNYTLRRTPDIEPFSEVLRQSEWYALVSFLLTNSSQRLDILCMRYGLSASHFRRLSRRVLGNTAKGAQRDWRLGQALLELVNSDDNLTTIAMNHGYASLSHFSNEVKYVLGMSPRNLKKLLQAN
ncbi:helix-turn-helix domain-containing protein [Yersinia kristensenii]|uniref:helix-turn-helix domain-containing protein n=1 Tax=Yersinia kristensenii TaxID=28152 RepID=UPI0005DFA820|nr:helix-turn-helix domain-containing protein [Yersinia kristensenii]CNF34621.1 AraC family transcription regulator [Yersinia kristensenii]